MTGIIEVIITIGVMGVLIWACYYLYGITVEQKQAEKELEEHFKQYMMNDIEALDAAVEKLIADKERIERAKAQAKLQHPCAYCGREVDPNDIASRMYKASNDGTGFRILYIHPKCLREMPKEEFSRLWQR